ncbi:hypothetical protein [Marinobacter sp. SS5-14b]|uniref:hypothetical protein n=1 Tax=Marinobacter sp. SS5-14b TaxID=3050456 RepID=UPI0026E01C10|nr:hypothetical protein [Marinobacter sp. SS5-14b]
MSLKDDVFARVEHVAGRLVPYLEESWLDVKTRLDDLNRSLAAQAVPEERRAQVSDLSLRSKGERAGQKTAEVKDFPKGGR